MYLALSLSLSHSLACFVLRCSRGQRVSIVHELLMSTILERHIRATSEYKRNEKCS